MPTFNWGRWLRSLYRRRRNMPYRRQEQRFARPRLERLEDRITPSVDPAALVTNPQTIAAAGAGFSPSLVQDPVNPQNLVEVHSNGSQIVGSYSSDGGLTWTSFLSIKNLVDPTSTANPPALFSQVSNATVTMDRAENIYITDLETNAANTAGALVFQRYEFTAGGPVPVAKNSVTNQSYQNVVITEYVNADSIFNPVVSADSNVPSYTDAGLTQTDTMATIEKPAGDPNPNGVTKGLFVAWSTQFTAPQSPVLANFNPNTIMVAGSQDGGLNFTSAQYVNDGTGAQKGYLGAQRDATPQIVFTQGSADGRVAGGQLAFVWNNIANNSIQLDASQPDGGVAATEAANSATFSGSLSPSNSTFPVVVQVSGVTIADGGMNYTAGDVLTVTPNGSTVTPTTITVNTVDLTGAITSATLTTGGLYSTPAPVTVTVTGGSGTGAKFNLSYGPTDFPDAAKVATGTSKVSKSGTSYNVNDLLQVGGGILEAASSPAVLKVTALKTPPGPSSVTAASVNSGGAYLVPPANPVATTDQTTATGKNATFNLKYGPDKPEVATYDDIVNITDANLLPTDLQVTLALTKPRLNDFSVELIPPGAASGVYLVQGGLTGANLGEINGHLIGTVFDDNAPRTINDASFTAPYLATFRPASGSLDSLLGGTINGDWQLVVTDYQNDGETTAAQIPIQHVDAWSLKFSDINTTGFGTDRTAVSGVLPGAVSMPYANANTGPFGPEGAGPGISAAVDNTLGAFSPYQGRMYIAYTVLGQGAPLNTDVYLISVDMNTGGAATNNAVKVNDDNAFDGSTGIRPQFMPTVAVDEATGTVGVMYYDSRWDPSLTRAANSFSVSIDGGQTFSSSTFLNTPKTATNEITEQSVTIEPVPGNQGQVGNTYGFGDRQGLVMFGGTAVPVFFSNDNAAGDVLKTARANYAAGPRIISGDMGPITSAVSGVSTILPDGTPELLGFHVTFDRPVQISSFTGNQVTLEFKLPTTAAGSPPDLIYSGTSAATGFTVTPLNPSNNWGAEGFPNGVANEEATQFLVSLNTPAHTSGPTAGKYVGTYSYTVGPDINDRLKTGNDVVAPYKNTVGNNMDENANGTAGQGNVDQFSIPTPLLTPTGTLPYANGNPFKLPYSSDTLPLIIPGPHVVSSAVPGNPVTSDNLVLNGANNAVDVTFDRSVLASSLTPANIIRVTGPVGPIPSYTTTTAVAIPAGGTVTSNLTVNDSLMVLSLGVGLNISYPNDSDLSVSLIAPDGTTVPLFAGVGGSGANFTNTILDDGSANLFSSNTAPFTGTFKPMGGTLASLNGKNFQGTWQLSITNSGSSTGTLNSWTLNPFTITPVNPTGSPAATTTFQIGLPTQALSGTYSIIIGPDSQGNYVTDLNGFQGDMNLNAGVNALFGGNPNNGALVPNAYPSPAGSSNVSLPPGQTVDSIINVPDSYLVQGVTVQLNIQHQNDPDLVATLIAPDGTRDLLFSGVGNSGSSPHANFTGTTLDDSASLPIQQAPTQPGIGIGVGPWTPQLPLSTFVSHGSLGNWTLEIQSNSSTLTGTLVNWTLTLKASIPGSGLAEPVADQYTAHFRIFTQDPTNPLSDQMWTPAGPAAIGGGASGSGPESSAGSRSGRIGGLAVDPSDPSGNTVYAAGASGGVWKTTNFLTTDPNGPTWIPLTNFGPAYSLDTGSIAVFGRNNDPNQSIVFVATGEGSGFEFGQPTGKGVGFLRSMDGGKTWEVLDSTTNVDASGNILPINSPSRDHKFVGTSGFRVIADPTMSATGVIVYAALSGNNGGIWRSDDSGGHWTLMRSGPATDVALSAGSADASGNLQILYGAIQGVGVFYTTSAPSAVFMTQMTGNQGVPTRRNTDVTPDQAIPVSNDTVSPNGPFGRIVLATPALVPNNPLANILYEGWVYALVITPGNALQGLYMTKDFGQNWVQVRIPVTTVNGVQLPTNDDTIATDYNVFGGGKFGQGNYDVTMALDPNNPNIVYMGGSSDGAPYGFIRIDTTTIGDPYSEVAYDNSNNDTGRVQFSTTGSLAPTNTGKPYGLLEPPFYLPPPVSPYLNMERDPNNPFLTPSSLHFTNVTSFNNVSGQDTKWIPFDGGGLGGTDQHQLIAMRDPLTGMTRLIFGDDQGVWTGTDNGTGTPIADIGFAQPVVGSRNGNLQITQFYYGANQPSTLAAQIAGALFYGTAQDDGFPVSTSNMLDTGNLVWNGPGGDYAGVGTDQTGGGTSYVYAWPCCGAGPLPSDFFLVNPQGTGYVSRITGLLQGSDDPGTSTGEWPFLGGSEFAVNPIDPSAIVMSSQTGQVFRTSGSTGYGVQWFVIAKPSDLDSSYAGALAFGAPSGPGNVPLNDFIYAGTDGGHIYVTTSGGGAGGGSAVWQDISTGLDGSAVQQIVTNPNRGSHEAYAVTQKGVYWMPDSLAKTPKWINITGNLFNLQTQYYDDPAQQGPTLKSLSTIQADYRYAIPDDFANPTGPTHPVLYVGGPAGVFRSFDKGTTWTYFPNVATDGAIVDGGFFPSALVSELNLSMGNINPATGFPYEPYGRNLLQATTYGSGTFVIRLTDTVLLSNGQQLHTYAVAPVVGPHVASINLVKNGSTITGLDVTFSGIIDPVTFTKAKINSLTAPDGTPIGIASVVDITPGTSPDPHNQWQINFSTSQSEYGFYRVSIGPRISDYAGYLMDQNQDGVNGDPVSDVFTGRVLFNPNPNNAPVLNDLTASVTPPVNEDDTPAVIAGTSVNNFITTDLSPSPGISDPDSATYGATTPPTTPPVGIAITGVDETNGIWQYSLDGGVTWIYFDFVPTIVGNGSGYSVGDVLTIMGGTATIPAELTVTSVNVAGGITGFVTTNNGNYTAAPTNPASVSGGTGTGATFNLVIGGPTASAARLLEGNSGGVASPDMIRFLPNLDFTGTASFTFQAWDETSGLNPVTGADGGTGDATINGGSTAFSTLSGTGTITVNFVNDQPAFTAGANQTVLEDTGAHTVNNWATNITPDGNLPPAADEAGQTLTFNVSTDNPGLFATAPAVSGGLWNAAGIGTLSYTLANDQSGVAHVTVDVQDNGGTANGGVDTSATQVFTITVTFVNDAPSFSLPASPNISVLEDSGADTVTAFATNISPDENTTPAANESGQKVYFTVTNDNPSLFLVPPSIDPGTATLWSSATGNLTFTPAPNVDGTANVTVQLHDNGGTANGGANASVTQVFTITVVFVNDQPSFAPGPDQTVLEDAGMQTVNGWATSVSPDQFYPADPNEAGQNLTFQVTNSNNALFAVQPTLALDVSNPGTAILSYTPMPDMYGSAVVTVVLSDDGGTANGGVDTSAAITFNINVLFVNDAPTFTAGPNQTVNEEAAPVSVPNWATNISPDNNPTPAADEAAQTVNFIVTNSNNAMFSVQPAISPSGTLSYTLAPDMVGNVVVTVKLHDNGGTANGGIDTSMATTFQIQVNAVNDAPSFTKGGDQVVNEDSSGHSVPAWATRISPDDMYPAAADEAGQSVNFVVVGNSNTSLFTATGQPAISPTGTLSYVLAPDVNGTATISVELHDSGGTANGGVDTSAVQTFNITANFVNDQPSFTPGTDQTVLEDSGAHTVANWATFVSPDQNYPPAANEAGQTLSFIVTTTDPSLFSVPPAISGGLWTDPNIGTLTYTLAPKSSGTASVTVQLQDNGGTANGGTDKSAPVTFNINALLVNEAPSFTKGADQTVPEDSGPQTVGPPQTTTPWATNISADGSYPADANEATQHLNFIVTNSNNALFTVQPAISSTGVLTYTPASQTNGTAVVTVQLHDDGGTANGGADTSAAQTFNITVQFVNDPPSFKIGSEQTVVKNAPAQTVPNFVTDISPDQNLIPAPNEAGQSVSFIVTNSNNALFAVQPAIDASGTLTYTPAADATGIATVTVQAKDNGGTANGGVDTSAPQTFLINLNNVNNPPSFTGGPDETVLENSGPQTVANWASNISSDQSYPPHASESNQLVNFIVSNDNPSLFSAQPSIDPASATLWSSATGNLTFTPATDMSGTAHVTVLLHDNGGTANGGIDTSQPQVFTINVTFVNQPPSFTAGPDQTVFEDGGAQNVPNWATRISPDQNVPPAANEASQNVNFTVTNSNNALFSVQPTVDSSGNLSYTLAPDVSGSAVVTVVLHDDGGTANGGIDTSAAQTFNINVAFVNDAPSFTKGADQTVLEDSGAHVASPWASNVSPDEHAVPAVNEAGQSVNFLVSNSNNALFSVQPSIDPAGNLTYTVAPRVSGSAVVTVQLHDNGGTANGGVDTSAAQTFNINVLFVNHAPSFTKGNDQTVLEDSGAHTVTNWASAISPDSTYPPAANEAGQSVNFIAGNNNNGLFAVQPAVSANGTLTYTLAPNVSGSATVTLQLHDNGGTANGGVDTSAAQTFNITVQLVNDPPSFSKGADVTVLEDSGADVVSPWATQISQDQSYPAAANEAGQTVNFTVTNSNAALFAVPPSVSPTGTLQFTPAANQSGSAVVTVVLHDNGGTANGGVDTSAAQTFNINVTFVNDPPSFTEGPDISVPENSPAKAIIGWATTISPDQGYPAAANEAGQLVTFTVSNSNNALFSVQPAVDPAGDLTFTAAPNASGSAVVTVIAHDNGGTANGGIDTSAPQTFNLNIVHVNQPPSFTAGPSETVLENSGPQTFPTWATKISPDQNYPPAPVEAGQTVNFLVSNNNNALFAVQPALDAAGTLTFTPATDASGIAIVTVQAHDNGGTANGGIDTSIAQTFDINVTFVNQAPSFTKGPDINVLEDAGAQTVPGWATRISPDQNYPPAANEAGQSLLFLINTSNNALFAVAPTIDPATGNLTYTLAHDASGSAVVTVQLHDNGGTANGGSDTSAPQTFNINVALINEAPTFAKGTDQTVLENAGPQSLTGWASRISADAVYPANPNEAGQALNFIVFNNNNALFSTQPSISPNGTLTYTPAANTSGSAQVLVLLHDNGGTANGGVDTSTPQTFNINVSFVNQPPSFLAGPDQNVAENSGTHTVPNWATQISQGPTAPPPPNQANETVNFIVTNNNNALFAVQPTIDPSGDLSYTLASNASGSAIVTVRLHNNGGTANGGVDTSAPQTFNINVSFVNRPPSFTKGPDQTVLEGAPAQTVTNWATKISPDQTYPPAPDEAGESVNFVLSNNNTALFAVQPAISANGTLTYTPAAESAGTAVVTVVAHNNGGTANGGVDTSAPQTFNIAVLFVNRAPSFAKGPDETALENSGLQAVPGWATNITPDGNLPPAPIEAGQALNFIVTNSNNALFAVQPAIDPAGDLTYTPALGASGSAVVTVELHDNGGTANGGVDTSAAQTFNLNITFVNQAPSFTKGPNETVGENAPAQTVLGWATRVSPDQNYPPAANEAGQALNFILSNNNNSLFSMQPALDASGDLTYTPTPNANGSALVTVLLHDNGGTANGGVDTSAPQTFTINVTISTGITLTVPGSSTYGQSVTLSAQVTPSAGSAAALAGEAIVFMDGTATIGAANMDTTGTATLATSSLTAGNHSITAVYAGDPVYSGSTSLSKVLTVNKIGTSMMLTAVPATNDFGQTETLIATVVPASGSTAALSGETVTFKDGSVTLGTATLDATGTAVFPTAALAAGTHVLNAFYNGDTVAFNGSNASTTATILIGTNTTLSSSKPTSSLSVPVVFTAHVIPTTGGTSGLSGQTVTFYDGVVLLGTGRLNAAGVATFSTSALTVGDHSITASFTANSTFDGSSSQPITQTVLSTKPSTTKLHTSSSVITVGHPVTFTAFVSASGGVPTGTVTFVIDGVSQAPVSLNNKGRATLTLRNLTIGKHSIQVIYNGDANFSGSSASVTQTVNRAVGRRL